MTIFSHSSSKSFLGVAIAIIIMGVIVFVVGVIQSFMVLLSEYVFGWPAAKVIGGLVIIALGYIQLQLELIRLKDK